MDIIGVFRAFFTGLGGFMQFMNTEIFLADFNGTSISVTPMTAFGLSLGVVLTITFALHLFHLLNPVG